MNATQYPVYTIGHSNHPPEAFLALLREHGVDEVVDVRSSPASRHYPQFNHRVLSDALERAGIGYEFLGGELGGRPADHSCYDEDGRVSYPRLAETDLFDDGIGRVVRAADERRVAVMCSEKDPQDCHRALLIAGALEERGVAVEHILADGSIERHDETVNRLLDRFKLPRGGDMFRSRDEVVVEALARQAERVAFVDERLAATSGGHAH